MAKIEFIECLAEFVGLKATYGLLRGDSAELDDELSDIMNDAFVNPFNDLVDATKNLTNEFKSSLETGLKIPSLDREDLLRGLAKQFLRPIDNVFAVLDSNLLPAGTREKFMSFLRGEGLTFSLTQPLNYIALIFMSGIQGLATISDQKKLLKQLDKSIRNLMNGIYDTPNLYPPVHPFREVLRHLSLAKGHYIGVNKELLIQNRINDGRFNEGTNELKLAQKTIFDGNLGETALRNLLNLTGLSNIIEVRNHDGKIELKSVEGLVLKLLPPVHLSFDVFLINKIRRQIGVYNTHLNNIDGLLTFVINTLNFLIDISRLLSSMVQFLVLEITDLQERLESCASGENSWGNSDVLATKGIAANIQTQAEAYGRLTILIELAGFFQGVLNRFNSDDVNDIPQLKGFREQLKRLDPAQCKKVSEDLDRTLANLSAAYNRRIAGGQPIAPVLALGARARGLIKQQLDYLDCFEGILNELGLDNIPAGVLSAIGTLGSSLAFIGGTQAIFSKANLTNQPFWKVFNENKLAPIVSAMKEKLQCMRDNCSQTGVRSMIDSLTIEFDRLDKLFKSNANLNMSFSDQAKFSRQFGSNKLQDLIKQFIDAISRLSC